MQNIYNPEDRDGAEPHLYRKRDDERVVVTGMGVVAPLGIGLEAFWNGLVSARSGIRRITLCDPGNSPSQIAGEVPDFEPREYMEGREARRISRVCQFAVAAADMALVNAQLPLDQCDRDEIGVLVANSSGSPIDDERSVQKLLSRGVAQFNSPYYLVHTLPNMSSSYIAMRFGLTGYSSTIATACAASAQAIGEAAEVIRRGDADIMLAGGAEAPISQITLAGFSTIMALSTYNDHPETASRPFDATRNGFVLGEGAGILVLERLSHAQSRGANIHAELIGYGVTCDACHPTAPHPEGRGAMLAMRRALNKSGVRPEQINYINAHATSTIAGDMVETIAIKRVFRDVAYKIPISATKSMIGHLTSASGAVEAVATILALRYGVIPPTINYETPDPVCDLNYVPNHARSADLQVVMTNSFAFGGINTTLVFRNLAL
jgi:3-oxoacyl-[acyl-carrier-protein] synthase II